MQEPTPGRIVLARVEPYENNGSDAAPAVVTRVWGEHGNGGWIVNLRVFTDADTPPLWKTSVRLVDTEDQADDGEKLVAWWPPKI
jgi:hypothetical protein